MPKDTALIKAVMLGDIKRVAPLINGETINVPGELGKTALHNAAFWKNTSSIILDLLLASGADVNATDDDGITPLLDAAQGALITNDVYAIKACKLIERGALWPDTEMGHFAWRKLPKELQQLFTEKLQAYQQRQTLLQAEEKTKAFGMLSGFAGYIHQNQGSQSATISSLGLHRRTVGQGNGIELKTFNN